MFRATLGVLALFVIPSPLLAASVKIEGDGHARIPFEMVGGHVWVRGRLNEADSVWVVIDTGASQSVMDAGLAKRMRLKEHGSHEAAGAGGVQAGSTVSNVTLELAGFKASFRTFDTTDLGAITTHGRHPFEVVLGSELFEACVVRFDYPAAMIDVCVTQHDRIDGLRFEGKVPPVAGRRVRTTLDHAAVEQQLAPGRTHDVTGPGHLARGAEKFQLHADLP